MGVLRSVCVAALAILALKAQAALAQERPRTLSGRYAAPVAESVCGTRLCRPSAVGPMFIDAMEADGARVEALFLRTTGFGVAGFFALRKTRVQRALCLVRPCCTREAHFSAIVADRVASDRDLLEIIAKVTPNTRWPSHTPPKLIDFSRRLFAIGFVVREVCPGRRVNKRIDLDPGEAAELFADTFPGVSRLLRQP